MKKLLFFAALLFTLSARAADIPVTVSDPGASLLPLASLVGGVWVGEISAGETKAPVKIEMEFRWTGNHQAIAFDSAFVTEGKRKPYTSGLYAWDGAKRKLVIFYVNDDGDITEGTITPHGGMLLNELTMTELSGKSYPIQARLTKVGNDVFENAIFLMKNGNWAPFATVKYVRQK